MAVQYSLTYWQRASENFSEDPGERVGIGRAVGGVEPTLWPVDISALLSSNYTPTTSTVRPRGFNREQTAVTFTIQAIDGSADLDKLQRIAQKSIELKMPGAIMLYNGEPPAGYSPWIVSGYIIGFAPQEFAWKDGSVAMECTFLPTSPWYRQPDEPLRNSTTFTLPEANLPSGIYLEAELTGSITITSDKGFSNVYYIGATGYLDTTGIILPGRADADLYASRPAACTPKGGGAYLFEGLPPDPTATYTITSSPSNLLARSLCFLIEARTAPTWEV